MAECTCCVHLPPSTAGTARELKHPLGYHCRTPSVHPGEDGPEKQFTSALVLPHIMAACGWPQLGW